MLRFLLTLAAAIAVCFLAVSYVVDFARDVISPPTRVAGFDPMHAARNARARSEQTRIDS